MSHNPDFQKDEIMAHKKREIERQIADAQAFAATDREFRAQLIGGLAHRFEAIIYAPNYPLDERRAKLLAWAHENRLAITQALRSHDAEQVPA